jgi:starch synthase
LNIWIIQIGFYFSSRQRYSWRDTAEIHPDVIHCHDWQTGLIPLFLKHQARVSFRKQIPRTVFTVHNLAFPGHFPPADWTNTGLPWSYVQPSGVEFWGGISYLKAGLVYADALTTVSPNYAREITTEEFGCGFQGILRQREADLVGILNGVDYAEWNTVRNPFLAHPYSADDPGGKAAAKSMLQSELGLPVRNDIPLFANITRLESQKGVDLIIDAIEQTLSEDYQFVIVGTGDPTLESAYRALAARHPHRISAQIRFDLALAHRVEAAADFYLMPSRFEPCGLNQMYSLRYGAIPIVRDTGGLHDTVVDVRESVDRATGVKFGEASAGALGHAMRKAFAVWGEPGLLEHLRRNGMKADFSWDRSAEQYVEIYRRLLGTRSTSTA